jgi:hypothetical protein
MNPAATASRLEYFTDRDVVLVVVDRRQRVIAEALEDLFSGCGYELVGIQEPVAVGPPEAVRVDLPTRTSVVSLLLDHALVSVPVC